MSQKDYIKYAEAVRLFSEAGLSETTFRRKVQEHPITRIMPEGRSRGALYSVLDVRAAIEQSHKETASKDTSLSQNGQDAQEDSQTDWIKFADEPYAYVLDCELYGVENAVSPSTTWTWWEKNPYACRILYNKNNRKDIWGLFSIIPMKEETIFRLLRGEMEEKEITAEHVLEYEPGQIYSCYVAAASMRPDKRQHFGRLLHSTMQFWYEQYPTIQISTLYAYALDGEEGEGIRLIRKLFFAPRYDIGENSWELRLDRYNPSPVIQQFQKSLKEKYTNELAAIPPLQEKISRQVDHPSATFRRATSWEDIAATVDIEGEIFNSKTDNDDFYVNLWHSWHQKNSEMFYVLEVGNRIVGFVSLLPLERQKIDRILREEESPSSITPEDIASFQPGVPLDLYVHVMGIRPEFSKVLKHGYGADLLRGLLGVFRDLGQRGVIISTLFARTRMPDGLQLMEHMHFTEMVPSLVPGKRHFFLEIAQSDDLLIREYKQALLRHKTGTQV